MERKKRPFFIIGHNPNTIEEAREFLQHGANALEPDIVFADGQFYISHAAHLSYTNVPTLIEYLQELKALLLAEQYNLALIIWDIKTVNFDPNHFIDIVKENFSGEPFDGITMLITNDDDYGFLNQFIGRYPNVGVGMDESDIPPSEIEKIFKNANQRNFSYADGIITFLNKPGVYENINEALHCRFENEPDSFGLIYTWVLSRESSLRKYLDIYIDGIMVDVGSVSLLKELTANPPYNEVYEMAKNGYNPFAAAPIPKYKLSVETKDKFMAGTDAQILFTLTGISDQTLKSLPFDGSVAGALERGSISCLMLEGIDLGEIKCLGVEALTDGVGAGWLPGTITVESARLKKKVNFILNSGDKEEWVTKKGGRLTIFPAS
jgi:PLAT/LH2 domain-containing protein